MKADVFANIKGHIKSLFLEKIKCRNLGSISFVSKSDLHSSLKASIKRLASYVLSPFAIPYYIMAGRKHERLSVIATLEQATEDQWLDEMLDEHVFDRTEFYKTIESLFDSALLDFDFLVKNLCQDDDAMQDTFQYYEPLVKELKQIANSVEKFLAIFASDQPLTLQKYRPLSNSG
jgi:hypothetical protein